MNKTEINWTDLTWNPASGCNKVSAECKYCYAETLAENKRGTAAFPFGFDMTLRPHKLSEPARVKAPSLVFTNSMSDLFHDDIPDAYRERCFAAMEDAPHHRYQVLTKRPEKALQWFKSRKVPDCVWLGVTIGVNDTARRADVLRGIDAKVRFMSCEPLLERLDALDVSGFAWVIGGGESGTHSSKPEALERRFLVRRGDRKAGEQLWVPREDRINYAQHLRDKVKDAGAAFWWKQWGGPRPHSGGRLLDGVEWNEMPDHIPGAMPDKSAPEKKTNHLRLL